MVLIVGAIYICWGTVMFLVDYAAEVNPGQGSHAAATLGLAAGLTIGMAMLACFAWCARSPRAALVSALVIWLSVQMLLAVISPVTISEGWLLKPLVMFFLIRGVIAALRAAPLMRRLAGAAT